MLGVAVLIIVISVMTGFDQELRNAILGFNAHLKIVLRGNEPMAQYEEARRLVERNPLVKGVAPFVLGRVLTQTQPLKGEAMVKAPFIRGVDWQLETNVSTWQTNFVQGEPDLEGNSLLVGTEFAREMDLKIGDVVSIYSPEALREMRARYQRKEKVTYLPPDYTVRGIFDVGYYEYNASVVVTSLENAQELYRLGNSVHGLMVMLHDPFQAEEARRQLWSVLGSNYRIELWTKENPALLDAIVVEKNVMFYLLFFIMIVAAFGIMNSLITFVVQKTREIGMLKALGASRGQILWLFLSQGFTVGIVGVMGGFVLGMLLLKLRNEFLIAMRWLTGAELFPARIYFFTKIPAKIIPADIVLICGSALIICILAALIPAWNAGRLRPVEALRHE
jgi:lipoprotein-releasing system permease protein